MSACPEWGRVLTAMITPFAEDGSVDEDGVRKLIDHLFRHGSDGIVVSGTTGESATLSVEEKCRLYALAVDASQGRGPVLAGTGTNSTADAVRLSQAAEAAGVDGLLIVTPYYNKPSQEGLYQHFRAVAEAVDLPVMVYNVPSRTSVSLDPATCVRLACDVPNIVALKDAGGNLLQTTDVVSGAPAGFRVYSGDDGLVLPMLAVGAHGVVSVTSHLVGEGLQAMIKAHLAGETSEAARHHARMLPIVRACFQPTTPSPAPLKAAMQILGLPAGAPRLPLVRANEAEKAIVRNALTGYGLPVTA